MFTDIIIIALFILVGYLGYKKGLVSRLLQLAKYVLAFIGAQLSAGIVGAYLASWFQIPAAWLARVEVVSLGLVNATTIWQSIAFIVIFIILVLAIGMIVNQIHFEDWIIVGWLSRIGGIFFNIAIWYIIIFIFVMITRIVAFDFFEQYLASSAIVQFMLQFMW